MTAKRTTPAQRQGAPAWLVPLLMGCGSALSAWALLLLVPRWIFLATATPTTPISPGADNLVLPLLLFLFAAIPFFLGEMFRRGTWSGTDRSLARGGRVVVHVRQVRFYMVLLWALVPLAFWVALVVVPVAALSAGTGFPAEAIGFWKFNGLWSFTTAAFFGALVGSLARRAAFARAKRQDRIAPERRQGLWQVVSGGARAELMLTAAGMGFLGSLPLVWGEWPAILWLGGIGVVLVAGGLLMTINAWRSGQDVGYAESAS